MLLFFNNIHSSKNSIYLKQIENLLLDRMKTFRINDNLEILGRKERIRYGDLDTFRPFPNIHTSTRSKNFTQLSIKSSTGLNDSRNAHEI